MSEYVYPDQTGTEFWVLPCWEYYENPPEYFVRSTREDVERDCAECYAYGGWWEQFPADFLASLEAFNPEGSAERFKRDMCHALPGATAWTRSGYIPITPLVPVRAKVCPSGFWRDVRWCPEGCAKCGEVAEVGEGAR